MPRPSSFSRYLPCLFLFGLFPLLMGATVGQCCRKDGECVPPSSSNGCVTLACIASKCQLAPNQPTDCCTADWFCNDDDPCTDDICLQGSCIHEPLLDCCQSIMDSCDDGDICTVDYCSTAALYDPLNPDGPSACAHDPIPGCYHLDADCGGYPCTPLENVMATPPLQPNSSYRWCSTTNGSCSDDSSCPMPCANSQCTLLNLHTTRYCEKRGCKDAPFKCYYDQSPWGREVPGLSCLHDSECVDPDFPAARGECSGYLCDFFHVAPAYTCKVAKDMIIAPCPAPPPCHTVRCEYNQSVLSTAWSTRYNGTYTQNTNLYLELQYLLGSVIGNNAVCLTEKKPDCDACISDEDCSDNNPCTIDTCYMTECVHEILGNCCTDKEPCITEDPCISGVCWHGQCNWLDPIPSCCYGHADCVGFGACAMGVCQPYEATCSVLVNSICCNTNNDCAVGTVCSNGECADLPDLSGLACQNDLQCLSADEACGGICTRCACMQGACSSEHIAGCCDTNLRLLIVEQGLQPLLQDEIDDLLLDWRAEGACVSVVALSVPGVPTAAVTIDPVANAALRQQLRKAFLESGLQGVFFLGRVGVMLRNTSNSELKLALFDGYWGDLDDAVMGMGNNGVVNSYAPKNSAGGKFVVGPEISVGRVLINETEAAQSGNAVAAYKKYLRKLHEYRHKKSFISKLVGVGCLNIEVGGELNHSVHSILAAIAMIMPEYDSEDVGEGILCSKK